jgi:predicted MFS family arabinose efflux permease
LAPVLLVPITLATSWRVALGCAALLVLAVIAVLYVNRARLTLSRTPVLLRAAEDATAEGSLDFLKLPAVWMCFGFFFFYAGALSIVQSFATESARQLHDVPAALAAMCLSVYMVCAAAGMVLGGFLASDPQRCERIVGAAFGLAAVFALLVGFADVPGWSVPVLFGAMGLASGMAGPSRDLLVKAAAPDNATGRVYGVVYGGLDIGQAVVPLFIGTLMDHGAYRGVWLSLAVLQGVLIVSAFNVRKVRRTRLQPTAA